jgi:putative ABC transport system ATP-binding protein
MAVEECAMSRANRTKAAALTSALVNESDVLLVDEPTAALDLRRSQDIVSLLARQCHDRGIAGVMVTHDHDVQGHCERVVEMVDGRLSATSV